MSLFKLGRFNLPEPRYLASDPAPVCPTKPDHERGGRLVCKHCGSRALPSVDRAPSDCFLAHEEDCKWVKEYIAWDSCGWAWWHCSEERRQAVNAMIHGREVVFSLNG